MPDSRTWIIGAPNEDKGHSTLLKKESENAAPNEPTAYPKECKRDEITEKILKI